MSNLREYALNEFKALGWVNKDGTFPDDMQGEVCSCLLELIEVFSEQYHSGTSATYTIDLFSKLAKYEPLSPLTGDDYEWVRVSYGLFQNKRCSHVFKDANRFNGQAYDIDAIVFYDVLKDDDGYEYKSYFTSSRSAKVIEFPYTPSSEYVEASS